MSKLVEERVKHYMAKGLTQKLATQYAWVDFWHKTEANCQIGSRSYLAVCEDCNEEKTFGAAMSVRSFLERHNGHKAWFRGTKAKWNGRKWG